MKKAIFFIFLSIILLIPQHSRAMLLIHVLGSDCPVMGVCPSPTPQATPTPQITPTPEPLDVQCTGSAVKNTVTWTAHVLGGSPPYTYSWIGDPLVKYKDSRSFTVTYPAEGTYVVAVQVTDLNYKSAVADCSVDVMAIAPTPIPTPMFIPTPTLPATNQNYTSCPTLDNSQINQKIANIEARLAKLESAYNTLNNFVQSAFAQLLQLVQSIGQLIK